MEQIQAFLAAYAPIVMIVVMYGAFYFMLLRPQKAEREKRAEMLRSLHKGNKVITIGGIYGEILNIEDNVIDLKIADNVIVKTARTAISSNISQGKSGKQSPSDEEAK